MNILYQEPSGSSVIVDPRRHPTILVLAEGYEPNAAGERRFRDEWRQIWEEILDIDPFGVWRVDVEAVAVYLWRSRMERNPLASSFAAAPPHTWKILTIDPDQVLTALTDIALADPATVDSSLSLLDDVIQTQSRVATHFLIVILAAHPDGNPWGTRPREWGETELRARSDCPYFVATHAVPGSGAIIAKAMGRIMGLGDEGEDPNYLASLDAYSIHPNLVVMEDDDANLDHIWYLWNHRVGLANVTQGDSPGLHRGGLGRSSGVHRFAPHCLMRLQVGNPEKRQIEDTLEFCPICQEYLESIVERYVGTGPVPDRTIDNQRLTFDEAHFKNLTELVLGRVVSRPDPIPPIRPWWQYTIDTSGHDRALVLRSVVAKTTHDGDPTMPLDQPVAESVTFTDLAVTFQNGGRVAVDLSRTVEGPVLLLGDTPKGDPLLREGVKWSAVVEVDGGGAGVLLLRVELAMVFRDPAADFDPPGAVEAMDVFPQIALSQVLPEALKLAPAHYTGRAASFHGAVRMLLNVNSPMHVQHMMAEAVGSRYGATDATPRNYASFFAESWLANRGPEQYMASVLPREIIDELGDAYFLAPGSVPIPLLGILLSQSNPMLDDLWDPLSAGWSGLFEYHNINLAQTREIVAVAGLSALDRHGHRRKGDYTWPPQGPYVAARTAVKEPRQGDYDNVHLHGHMGTVHNRPGLDMGLPRVMAPSCGHSCLHFHWRWFNSGYFASTWPVPAKLQDMIPTGLYTAWLEVMIRRSLELDDIDERQFEAELEEWVKLIPPPGRPLANHYKGWSTDKTGRVRAFVTPGSPLVPPNQEIKVAILNPANDTLGVPLDRQRKVFRYLANIELAAANVDPTWPQVIFEQGCGLAHRYMPSFVEWGVRILLWWERQDPNYLPFILPGVSFQNNKPIIHVRFQPNPNMYDINKVFVEGYDMIRWIERDNNPMTDVSAGGQVLCTRQATGGLPAQPNLTLEAL